MVTMAKESKEVTPEKRSMIAQAFKSAVDVRRSARRSIQQKLQKMGAQDGEVRKFLQEQRDQVEDELSNISKLLTMVVDEFLWKSAATHEGKVFCCNMYICPPLVCLSNRCTARVTMRDMWLRPRLDSSE